MHHDRSGPITLPSAATGLKSRHRQWESPSWWGDHLQRLPELVDRTGVSAETRAYLQELEAYDAAAERNGADHTHPPKPPTADMAYDVSAICAKSIALLMDYTKTGKFPTDWNTEPSPESQSAAAELIDRQSPDILG